MPISPDFKSIHDIPWTIDFTQCAPNGHLSYVSLCNLLQLTAAAHSITGGLSFNDMQAHDQAWVLGRIRIEIGDLPRWQQTVQATTWIENLQGANSIRNIELYDGKRKIVGATTFWAVLNTKLRKAEPLALPHGHFEKYPERHATAHPVSRLNLPKETVLVAEHTVKLSDLDIVDHANNVKYLEWCLDAIDAKPIVARAIKSIEMNFLRELGYGDTVQIHAANENPPRQFVITKAGKACFLLYLEWS